MLLPETFTSVIAHEPGASIVGKASDGKIYTVTNEAGVVHISSPSIERTLLNDGAENLGKMIVDSFAPVVAAAAPTKSMRRGSNLIVAAAMMAFCAFVGIAFWAKPFERSIPTPQSVEAANLGHRPEIAAAAAPAQPSIEIPTRVSTVSVDPVPAAPAAAIATPATADQATGAAGIAERTSAAIESMNGSQAEARDLIAEVGAETVSSQLDGMRDVLATLTSGGKLTPEAIDKLPHELAASLRAAGALQSLEDVAADAGTYSILRLPPTVVDQYMDADGVPTIPDANGWVATGGYVRVPLPGGGDVSRPEHLLAFGLEP